MNFWKKEIIHFRIKCRSLLAIVKHIDSIGDAKIEEVLDDYIAFYQDRLSRGLQVDRSTCPYDEKC